MKILNKSTADEYAKWFRCLGDGTRIRILNFVASADQPLTVGEIVSEIAKSQSTVSHHLQILADGKFIFMASDGCRTIVSVNKKCMTELPEAAMTILARRSESKGRDR